MRFKLIPLIILAAILAGCSGSSAKNPIAPANPVSNHVSANTNRQLWGIWDVIISADCQTLEIVPLRTSDMHLNVVKLIEVYPCATCLKIGNIKLTGPNELSVDLTLTHPYPGLLRYTGFDVRGIFISTADYTFPVSGRKIALGDTVPRMLDPDGFTSLFNPTEFPPTTPAALGYIPGKHATGGDLSSTLNPFIAYKKDFPRRMFGAGTSETKTLTIYAPVGPIHFGYAVDACWQLVDKVVDPVKDFPPDANCLEAYAMSVDIGTGLQPFVGSSAPIGVEVYDHQGLDTISSVTVEAPALFNGEVGLTFSTAMPDGGFLYSGTLSNDLGGPKGQTLVLVKATDTQTDQNLGQIAAWQISSAIVNLPIGWARTWGGSNEDSGCKVDVDGSGNVYVIGKFTGTSVDFNPDPTAEDLHSSNGECDVFLSKFDSSGTFVWARTWGGSDWDEGHGIVVDGSGNVYVTGYFSGTSVDFNPDPTAEDLHSSSGEGDIFLSKFDSSGTFVWARTWGGSADDRGHGVSVDGSGNVYVTGYFYGTSVDFNPDPIEVDSHSSNGTADIFLSKFDSFGTFVWGRTWGGSDADSGNGVAVDGFGNVYLTGSFSGTSVDFDPDPALVDPHSSNGQYDIFLSKFDSSGTFIWTRTWGGESDDHGEGVAVDISGNMYVTGMFRGDSVDFNPDSTLVDPQTSNGGFDIFLSKYDSSGTFVWARAWGGSSDDSGSDVAVDGSANVYVMGSFIGPSVDFDPGTPVDPHSSNGGQDIFLSKFDSSGTFSWARTWGGSKTDWGWGVDVDGSGNVYATGAFQGDSVDFHPDPTAVDPHSSNGDSDAFLTKFKPDGNW